jgi:phosphoribosylamine--glycine ligase
VIAFCKDKKIDFVVVGPEAPLCAGIADDLEAAGIKTFGPSKWAARLEGSKGFTKDLCKANNIPTAAYQRFKSAAAAKDYVRAKGAPIVVKNDGLAAGKGVVVTSDRTEAERHAAACARTVIEEYLDGPEVSLFVVTDGTAAVPLLPAQDFKRVGDGDTGPNTGGMGAYAPLPWAPPDLVQGVLQQVAHPTLAEMRRRDTPFSGLLYVGLALTKDGPKVVEFNARFGDPETEAVLALLETPLAGLLHAAATGTLAAHPPLRWRPGAAVTVVIASEGYPNAPRTGQTIAGADQPGVLHAGTARRTSDGALLSAGGRVLACTATGADLAAARAAAYSLVDGVRIDGAHWRTDIALAAAQQAL